jgi:hypothetical protein
MPNDTSDTSSLTEAIYAAAEKTLDQFGTKRVLLSALTRISILERQVLNLHDRVKQHDARAAAD